MRKKKWVYHDLVIKSFCCVFLCMLLLGQESFGQGQEYKNTKVTMSVKNLKLSQALDTLAKVTNVRFFYNHSQVDGDKNVSFDVKERSLDYVLMLVLGDQPVEVEYQMNRVVVLKYKQSKSGVTMFKIRGMVVDAKTKESLPGASIILKENKGIGVVTDVDGKFFIEVPEGTSALVVSFVGYEEETVEITGNMDNVVIKLTEKQTELEDVVVTGMAPRKVSGFTGRYVTVKGEELKRLNPNNLLQALQVFDPSFRIVENNQYGSDPNRLPEFRLRGDSQLGALGDTDAANFQMLMGDYSNRPNMPLFILDGFEASLQRIVDLDPERVESITILKDAAGTALYGSKASNGVIIFETKKPKPGALTLSYGGNIGISIPDLSDYNLMNAAEKLEYERKAGLFSTVAQMNYYNKKKEEILRGVNTYWLSQPLRTAITHRHTLSMEGGDEAIRYNLNLNYEDEYGVMKGSDRNNLGLTLTLQYRRKKWNISNALTMTNTKANNSPYGSFAQYARMNPYYRLTDENGKYQKVIELKATGSGTQTITNPLYNVQFPHKDMSNNFSVVDNFSLEYAIMDNLRVNAQVSLTKSTARSEVFKSSNHTDFANEEDLTKRGSYTKNTGESVGWNANASLNYNFVKGKHGMFALLRWNVESSVSDGINLSAKGFPNDNMTDFLFAFEMDQRVNGQEATSRGVGLLASLNYMYDQRYSVDFNLRGDLASQFGGNTGMAPFWSVGLRWNMHEEKWFKNTIVSNLTLFGSIGETGSQSYSPYQAKETYTFEYGDGMYPYPSGDVLGAQLMGIGNPDLGWSKTMAKSVSLDLGLWNSRLNASVSYYHNYTDQMLLATNVQPSTGFASMTRNVGAVLNEGVDVSLNGLVINDYNRQIQWSIGMNATHNRNVIKKLSNELKEMNRQNQENQSEILPIYEEGESTSVLKLVPSLGIDPATGKEMFRKLNGEKTFVWDAADKIPVGDTEPKLRGSISSSLTWKNFTATLGFTYQFGGDRYNETLVSKIENSNIYDNVDKRAGGADRWSETNRFAKYKGMELYSQQTPTSTRFLQKFNEFVFNSISVGYRLEPKQFKFLEACRIASLSLTGSMQDIGRFSSVKQERGLDYPFARSFNLSLSVLFN